MACLKNFSFLLCFAVFSGLCQSSASSILNSPLSSFFHVGQVLRIKRQASRANATDPDHDPDICVLKCLRSTEEKLGALQVEGQAQAPLSAQSALRKDYDPKDFQKLCDEVHTDPCTVCPATRRVHAWNPRGHNWNHMVPLQAVVDLVTGECLLCAYRPGKDCLDACETTKLKRAALRGMALLQFMCVERYQDFKTNLPCMNNASAEAEIACKPNCTEFEPSVNRLEELSSNRELVINLSQQELSQTLAGSCQYVSCLGRCGNPITERRCGKKVAELDEELVKNVFNSLRFTVTVLGAGDQLPKECLKLSG